MMNQDTNVTLNNGRNLDRGQLFSRAEKMIQTTDDVSKTIQGLKGDGSIALIKPEGGYVNCRETFATYLDVKGAEIADLGVLPRETRGLKLVALRYIIANGEVWDTYFNWRDPLRATLVLDFKDEAVSEKQILSRIEPKIKEVESLIRQVKELKLNIQTYFSVDKDFIDRSFVSCFEVFESQNFGELLKWLVLFESSNSIKEVAKKLLQEKASELYRKNPTHLDLLYLALSDLSGYPAHSVSAGKLKYIIIADKGEMGVRATKEAISIGKIPIVLFSLQDDANSLQVRLAKKHGGFTIGLSGNFRESYANYFQIADKVAKEFQNRFSTQWRNELRLAALYPGYGPLAENSAAIRHFRRNGIIFVGPMQNVVERAGDKRQFRQIVETLDPLAVTPGITIESDSILEITQAVQSGLRENKFSLPGRIKAANGGGGRGQAIVRTLDDLKPAIQKVLGEIQSYGWEPGVMFEQNISQTIHLEVQILRDRYGNTRHFGMRDCSEQRASQKIQEEAPPAILKNNLELRTRVERLAVNIADQVGYVGAGTVELMYKNGKYYFLEMNTRIQVEHPVTELSHGIRRNLGEIKPLNLVQWQMHLADGKPIDFEQKDVAKVAVAREFRINAESWEAKLKDSRDGKLGIFIPNAGRFDEIRIPSQKMLLATFSKKNKDLYSSILSLDVRFDCGFEKGDVLVNKDPTFGKLIIAVASRDPSKEYEVLRLVCIEALKRVTIKGKQVLPNGRLIRDSEFKTNIADHIRILEDEIMKQHSQGNNPQRHVNWVIESLRA